jgi:hypothetical protein
MGERRAERTVGPTPWSPGRASGVTTATAPLPGE